MRSSSGTLSSGRDELRHGGLAMRSGGCGLGHGSPPLAPPSATKPVVLEGAPDRCLPMKVPPGGHSGALQLLLEQECRNPASLQALQPHSTLLLNAFDVMMRSPLGDRSMRAFLRYVDGLHSEVDVCRAEAKRLSAELQATTGHLHKEREARNQEGFQAALHAKAQAEHLQQERHARSVVEQENISLRKRVQYSSHVQLGQAHELQGLSRVFAEAEINMESNLREEVRRQEEMLRSERDQALAWMRADCQRRLEEAQHLEEALRSELQSERGSLAALREENSRLETALAPYRQLLSSARLPCVVELLRFLVEDAPRAVPRSHPLRAALPVLMLEWLPETRLGLRPEWPTFDSNGVYSLLDRLVAGQILMEDFELTVWHVEGRWISGLEVDNQRFAALMMYQALRLDLTVMANCRVVPMKRASLPQELLRLDPAKRTVPRYGGANEDLKPPKRPDTDEALLRQLLRGCPMERGLLSALCYVNATNPDALRRSYPMPDGY